MNEKFSWKKIITYYGIAIFITWIISFLIIINVLPKWFHYFNALGPMLGSLFIIWRTNTFNRFIAFFNIKKWKWVLIGGTSPIWITAILYLLILLFGGSLPDLSLLGEVNFLGNVGVSVFLLWLLSFGIGEEIGWRGFLLPELIKKYSVLKSTLIIWFMWVLWHLPFFFYIPNYMDMNISAIIGFVFSLLAGTILLTWLFLKSNKSLITVILWHASFDFITASAFGQGNIAMILSMIVIISSIIIFIQWLMKINKSQKTNLAKQDI